MYELKLIEVFYGDKVAKRSGVPLIQHIYDGLTILSKLDATVKTMKAFCLHPLFQSDAVLPLSYKSEFVRTLDPNVMLLVMEYRHRANNWLSNRVVLRPGSRKMFLFNGRPSWGNLTEVRHMLIADKVQNYYDFRIYHKSSHPRTIELEEYFRQWLIELGIDNVDEMASTIADGRIYRCLHGVPTYWED